jgi:hypothetical protein
MRQFKVIVCLVLASPSVRANLVTLYSNYGVSPAAPFDPTFGDTVSNGSNDLSASFAFTVGGTQNLALNQILFTASIVSSTDPNSVTLSIEKNNGGQPGTQIFTSGAITGQMGILGSATQPPVTIDYTAISGGTVLMAGATYWLTLDGPAAAHVAWNANGQGLNGTEEFLQAGAWTPASREVGAFAIIGQTPEPGTLALFGAGLALAGVRRRSHNQSPPKERS